jgi:hypothetical protein
MAALLKLALVPLVIWLASVAGRRWGHAATGWISGLPLIAGPISVFLALDQGLRFAADAAAATLQVTGAAALHCFVFARASRRFGWAASLLLGWAAFVAGAAILGAVPLPPLAGAGITALALGLMLVNLPPVPRAGGPVPIPGVELAVRIVAALAIATAVTLGASLFGPRVSGILLAFPITGSVLPAFALALHGSDATVRLLAGFLSGLFAFAAFHLVVAVALPALGALVAFPVAFAAGLAAAGGVMRVRALAEPR